MKKALLAMILVAVFSGAQTQDLHIYYDVHNDSLWFMKNGKRTTELTVRRNRQVHFHLVEFNNYIYSAGFDALNHALPPAGHGEDKSLQQGLVSDLFGSFFPGGNLPFMDIPVFGTLLSAISGGKIGGKARGELEELDQFNIELEALDAETKALNLRIADFNQRQRAARLLTGGNEYARHLCTLEGVAPKLIRELLLDHFRQAFLIESSEAFSLTDIDALNEKLVSIPQLHRQLIEGTVAYRTRINSIHQRALRLKTLDHGVEELYSLLARYDREMPQADEILSKTEQVIRTGIAPANLEPTSDYQARIRDFYTLYLEIRNNDFAYTHHAKAESRFLLYTLKLFRKENMQQGPENSEELKPIKTITLKIDTYGDVRLGTSLGLNVGRYGSTPQEYFVRNDALQAADADAFAPLLCSSIDISYSLTPGFSPSLNIGVGLPLKSTDQTESLAFFIGPGLSFGKTQSVMLAGGFMFSKVSRLARGLQVGDPIQIGDGIIPTEKKFDVGYFLGLAYKLNN
ncbi:MAG: hypothetical protein KBH75_10590 [Saprospiraceae bacterium]|jgi:hypothetical protein|nr:hypothetical protein [Saprospiraceae bacterium]